MTNYRIRREGGYFYPEIRMERKRWVFFGPLVEVWKRIPVLETWASIDYSADKFDTAFDAITKHAAEAVDLAREKKLSDGKHGEIIWSGWVQRG